MRNKYTKEFEEFVRKNISKYTKKDFISLLESKFDLKISEDALRRYLNRHEIDGKPLDYKKYNARNVQKCPIGTERMTSEGVFVKVAHPDKWKRKSRVMYEKYHNCKLKNNEYIVFLNWNNNDFRKENLMKSTQNEIAYLHNYETFSKNPKLTKLGILSAKLMILAKERG